MSRYIEAKTILSHVKQGQDNVFGLKYNMNLYRGCQHGCIYCDSRSKCYQLGELSDIRIKENALTLLEKELKSKRFKGTIGFGSMNDPYMPVEKEMELTRGALQLISRYKYPVHIITKSNLVLRDIDILKEISKTYVAISLTITANDDNLSKLIEPGAPVSSERFEAIKKLSHAGIYTGIMLMPVLPFITDEKDNIKSIVTKGKQNGAGYVIAFMGMTLREGQREHFYEKLDHHFPGLKNKYMQSYGNQYGCSAPNHKALYDTFYAVCSGVSMQTSMNFYDDKEPQQMKLF
jgi:DNA repair photolyase